MYKLPSKLNEDQIKDIISLIPNTPPSKIARDFKISRQTVHYYKKKQEERSKEEIEDIYNFASIYKSYEKQAKCEHKNSKISLHLLGCCGLVTNDLDKIIEICQRMKEENTKLIEVKL